MDAASPTPSSARTIGTAARLMPTLLRIGACRVPGDVRVVGIDDVEYAKLLPVPLTTLRQPTRQIGDAALAAMLERVASTHLPTRDILLNCELIVRDSCGAKRARTSTIVAQGFSPAIRQLAKDDASERSEPRERPAFAP